MKKQVLAITLLGAFCAQQVQGMETYIPTMATLKNGVNVVKNKLPNNWKTYTIVGSLTIGGGMGAYYYYKNKNKPLTEKETKARTIFTDIKTVFMNKNSDTTVKLKQAIQTILEKKESKTLLVDVLDYGNGALQQMAKESDIETKTYIDNLYQERAAQTKTIETINTIKSIWNKNDWLCLLTFTNKLNEIKKILGNNKVLTEDIVTILEFNDCELCHWAFNLLKTARDEESKNSSTTFSARYTETLSAYKTIYSYYYDDNKADKIAAYRNAQEDSKKKKN